MLRRLFHRLEQSVKRLLREHVDFVDDIDLEPRPGRAELGVGDQVADVIHAGVAGRVDLDDIDVLTSRDALAGIALAARFGRRHLGLLAIQRLGHDPRHRGLADPARPAEQIRMRDASRFDCLLQRLRNMVLADDFVESVGAVSAGKDGVCGHFNQILGTHSRS